MNYKELLERAKEAAEYSYSPYSSFRVGAALLCANGLIITGTNVENRSYGLTICAERSAFVQALSKGIKDFEALAVVCPEADYPVSPCGACRQFISEFVPPDFPILFKGGKGAVVETTMKDLFPYDALHDLKK